MPTDQQRPGYMVNQSIRPGVSWSREDNSALVDYDHLMYPLGILIRFLKL
jgi:hypothetical protein